MGYAQVGYYSTQPFYQPPVLGDIMAEPREIITEDDYAVADSIDHCLSEISQYRPRMVIALEIWEGAYPEAASSRGARCKERGVTYGACQKAAGRCKRELERLMYGQ